MRALALAAVAAVGMVGTADAALYQFRFAAKLSEAYDAGSQEFFPSGISIWGSFLIDTPSLANLSLSENSTSGYSAIKAAWVYGFKGNALKKLDQDYLTITSSMVSISTDATGALSNLGAAFDWVTPRGTGRTTYSTFENAYVMDFDLVSLDSYGAWRIEAHDDISEVPLPAAGFLLAAPILAGAALSRRRLTSAG